ncbi:MAG: fluoride efflux transporter CrcB [Chitinophagaceae bacterium]|jgi:CrcB protein|nr:fluoride efflux transporter CrcB [Chitinophagaceae bacterium]
MKILFLIGTGSFMGGIFRYLLSKIIQAKTLSVFPFGTLTVNILGCFLIGIVFGLVDKNSITQEWKLFLTTGLLGGFTTFSAFSIESINLFKGGQFWYAVAYISASLFLGLTATYFGKLIIES